MARREDNDNSSSWKKTAGIIGLGAAGLAAAYGLYALLNKEEPHAAHTYTQCEPLPKPRVPLTREIDCSICLEKILYSNDCIFLPCCHVFHRKCIQQWTKIQPTCSMCRMKISKSELNLIATSTSS